jgi:hypothetical protein
LQQQILKIDSSSCLIRLVFTYSASGTLLASSLSMSRIYSLVFAVAFSAGTIASLPCVCAKDTIDAWSATTITCTDRYNALIGEAKSALSRGDQHAALRGLIAARSQLRSCEERDHDSATGVVAIALNSPRLADCCR